MKREQLMKLEAMRNTVEMLSVSANDHEDYMEYRDLDYLNVLDNVIFDLEARIQIAEYVIKRKQAVLEISWNKLLRMWNNPYSERIRNISCKNNKLFEFDLKGTTEEILNKLLI